MSWTVKFHTQRIYLLLPISSTDTTILTFFPVPFISNIPGGEFVFTLFGADIPHFEVLKRTPSVSETVRHLLVLL